MNQQQEYGELVYQYTGRLTDITEFGASMQAVLAGDAPIPPAGLRVDIAFEGEVRGKLAGYVKGVDHLYLRPDGRMELDIKATVTTPDGERIALTAGGVGIPQAGSFKSMLREHVKLTTASPAYAWVNALEIWAVGEGDVETRQLEVRGYLP